jgi:hypothetical protein
MMTALDFWAGQGFQVLWVHLTTAPDGDAGRLAYHHKRLRQSVEAKWGYEGLQFVEVITKEGHGVIHALWAWRPHTWRRGEKARPFYVPQRWLSEAWGRIHGAKVVWIEKVRTEEAGRLARYMAGQYMAGQEAVVRITASWKRMLGISGVRLWRWWRAHYRETERKEALMTWKDLLRSGKADLRNVGEVSLLSIRARARAWIKVEETLGRPRDRKARSRFYENVERSDEQAL